MMSKMFHGWMWMAVAALMLALPTNAKADETNACGIGDAIAGFGLALDPSNDVSLHLTAGERELLSLAIPGYLDALEAEKAGAESGAFDFRAIGLGWFIDITVPCIRDKINIDGVPGDFISPPVDVDFNSFERIAVQIMASIWNRRNGVMAFHLKGCKASHELRNAILCPTFTSLADAAQTLFKKVTKDQ